MHPMYQQMIERGLDPRSAGYFDGGDPADLDVLRGIPAPEKSIIIGLSGCFAPLHAGHVQAMEIAASHFREQGYAKIVHMIFPAHDSYVRQKVGSDEWNIERRQEVINRDLPYYMQIDYVPALEFPCEVNFPHLIDRLKAWSNHHGCQETAFVVGSDNAHFAEAFHGSETKFLVIHRDGHLTNHAAIPNHDSDTSRLSSTRLRSQG